jgi:large subunit ribosomal protein L23Ae
VHFRRPKTLRVRRKPKFPKRAAYPIKFQNDYDILRCPVNTEAAMRKVENLNTLVFVVDAKATKPMIKKAFERLYNVKCRKVNTLITFAPFSFLNLILSLVIVVFFCFSFDNYLT